MFNLSEGAARKIRALKEEEGKPQEHFLRVEIQKGGCAGMSYKMDFDSNLKANDKVFESNGQKVVVDPMSFMYVIGMTLDYEGGLNGKGFIFSNPNASKSCGCGTSFNVKDLKLDAMKSELKTDTTNDCG